MALPGSVLFACDHNAIRSPMAEALAKKMLGARLYIQSVGVDSVLEVDGFAIMVCAEIGLDIAGHEVKSFDDMEAAGEDIGAYDLIVTLSPAAQRRALEYTREYPVEVEYWATLDPSGLGERRDQKLAAYRQCRDQLVEKIRARFLT